MDNLKRVVNFERDLTNLLNMYSLDNDSDTPDFILAKYINDCLNAFIVAMGKRDSWRNPIQSECLRRE